MAKLRGLMKLENMKIMYRKVEHKNWIFDSLTEEQFDFLKTIIIKIPKIFILIESAKDVWNDGNECHAYSRAKLNNALLELEKDNG